MRYTIRPATLHDFDELYRLGLATQEIQVDPGDAFMSPEEFHSAITSTCGYFLLAEVHEKIGGFIFVNTSDIEVPRRRWACLVYLVVEAHLRRQGIGTALYRECEALLRANGISHLYLWAEHSGGNQLSPIMALMQREFFSRGKSYVWMQKVLLPRH